MKVFLTGGTGFIGQTLTHSLLAHGWNVIALVRNLDSSQALILNKMGARCVPGDITDRESMRAGMAGADTVIHNAAWYEFGVDKASHERMWVINVGGTENVLGLVLELDIPRTVYVSTAFYYGATGLEPCDETYERQAPCLSCYEQTKV